MRRADEIPDAIQWHDGMLLSPQHFQESARRYERLLDYHLDYAAPFHYGVVNVDVDGGLLVSGTFRVNEIEAVMPDGLVVRHTTRDPNLEADLKPHAAAMAAGPLNVFLAVSRDGLGGSSVVGDFARYRAVVGAPVPDENTGEGEIAVHRLAPSLRLVVAAEPPARYVCLPIARVQRDGEAYARARYVAPSLTVPLGSPIGKLCAMIVSRLREKALRLADKANALSMNTDRELIGELRRQINSLVAALPVFEAVLNTDRSHPFPLYIALCGLIGQIAALARTPVPPVLPAYKHDDMLAAFLEAHNHLFRMVDEGILESFTAHPFTLDQNRLRLDFLREWSGRPIVLSVKPRRGASEGDTLAWVQSSLIGAAPRSREMQESRVLGVGRRRVDRYGDLVATGGAILFELEDGSPYITPGEQLVLFNTADPSNASAPAEIVLYVKAVS